MPHRRGGSSGLASGDRCAPSCTRNGWQARASTCACSSPARWPGGARWTWQQWRGGPWGGGGRHSGGVFLYGARGGRETPRAGGREKGGGGGPLPPPTGG